MLFAVSLALCINHSAAHWTQKRAGDAYLGCVLGPR